MKKLCIFGILIIGLIIPTKSQNNIIQIGVNYYSSSSEFEFAPIEKLNITPHLFYFQETELTKKFAVLGGIGINGKGVKTKNSVNNNVSYIYRSYYYIEVPLLVSFKFPIKDNYKIFCRFGPSLDVLLLNHSRHLQESQTGNTNSYNDFEFFDEFQNLFDLNVNLSVGLERKNLLLELKYGLGFNFPYGDPINQGISLSFGYKFLEK